MKTTKTIPAWALAVSTLALAGCATPNNARTVLGTGESAVSLPAFSARTGPATWDSGPSLTGLARDNWAQRTIVVPNDGVEHHPHLTTTDHHGRSPAYPTIESALAPETHARHPLAQFFLWPIDLGRDAVLAIGRSSGGNLAGPDGPVYERVPRAEDEAGAGS